MELNEAIKCFESGNLVGFTPADCGQTASWLRELQDLRNKIDDIADAVWDVESDNYEAAERVRHLI